MVEPLTNNHMHLKADDDHLVNFQNNNNNNNNCLSEYVILTLHYVQHCALCSYINWCKQTSMRTASSGVLSALNDHRAIITSHYFI